MALKRMSWEISITARFFTGSQCRSIFERWRVFRSDRINAEFRCHLFHVCPRATKDEVTHYSPSMDEDSIPRTIQPYLMRRDLSTWTSATSNSTESTKDNIWVSTNSNAAALLSTLNPGFQIAAFISRRILESWYIITREKEVEFAIASWVAI